MPAILVNANQPSPNDDGHGVRELHPAPGTLPALIALTADAGLIHAIEEVATAAAGLSVTQSVSDFSEHLMQGTAGIALIDAAAVPTVIQEFVDGIARQFPELVLVVAGGLAEQSQLAAQIGSGRVYRFVHKPASAQRLKLFIEAAARHRHDLKRPEPPAVAPAKQPPPVAQAPTGTGARRPPPSRQLLLGGAVAAAVVVGAITFFALRDGTAPKPAVVQETARREAARAALAAQQEAQATAQAKARVDLEQLLSSAETAFIEGRLDDAERLAVAAQATAQAQQPGAPDNSRMKFLHTQIARERERVGSEDQRRVAVTARQTRLANFLRLVDDRLQKGALIDPARDSALYYVEAALDLAPGDGDTVAARNSLVRVLLQTADRSIAGNEVDTARRMVDAAAGLGAPKSELDRLRRRADDQRVATAASAATDAASAGGAGANVGTAPLPAAAGSAAATQASEAAPATVSAASLKRLRYVEVEYPQSARYRGTAGFVELEFTVTPDGSVTNLEVTDAEPRNVFEKNALAAVSKWRFAPVVRGGVAVEQRARVRVRFVGK